MSATVCVPITDLRREPVSAKAGYVRDFLQETQLLYGEAVRVLEEMGSWVRVEALQQPKYIPGKGWKGYPGWVNTADICFIDYTPNYTIQTLWATVYQDNHFKSDVVCLLPFGALCMALPTEDSGWFEIQLVDGRRGFLMRGKTEPLLAKTELFIGFPYLWGGCSPYDPNWNHCTTSVDCSGLVHLAFRSMGVTVPRDAKDQCMVVQAVHRLSPGDLVFCADIQAPEKVNHVMIFESGENLIEACLDAGGVRRISMEDKFGVSLRELCEGKAPKHSVIFGRL